MFILLYLKCVLSLSSCQLGKSTCRLKTRGRNIIKNCQDERKKTNALEGTDKSKGRAAETSGKRSLGKRAPWKSNHIISCVPLAWSQMLQVVALQMCVS